MNIDKAKVLVACCGDHQLTIVQFMLSGEADDLYITIPFLKQGIARSPEFVLSNDAKTLLKIVSVSENHFGWPKEWWNADGTEDYSWIVPENSQVVPTQSMEICSSLEEAIQHIPTEMRGNSTLTSDNNTGYIVMRFCGTGWTTPIAWLTVNPSKKLYVPVGNNNIGFDQFPCEIISMGSAESFAVSGDVSLCDSGDPALMELHRIISAVVPFNQRSLSQPYFRRLITNINVPPSKLVWETSEGLCSGTCTYHRTGANYVVQVWFECHTCGLYDGAGCCFECAKRCHRGHNVVEKGFGLFYCDCAEANRCSLTQPQTPIIINTSNPLFSELD